MWQIPPRNLVKEMLDLYETNREKDYTRDACFPQFGKFIEKLSAGYKNNFASLEANKEKVLDKNIFSQDWTLEDIEFILTVIDLNLNNPYRVKFNSAGSDSKPHDVVSVCGFTKENLEEFRRIIQTYLLELLKPSQIKPRNESLEKFCKKFVEDGDMIITFNYDLLIEQELWKLKKWTPLNGYQIGDINTVDRQLEVVAKEIELKGIGKSKVGLCKLHGSLNWKLYLNGDLEIRLTDHETGECYFDGITAKGPGTGKPYEGKDDLVGMPPSFIKVLPTKEFHELWHGTLNKITEAREVYMIGYRLPEADLMAHLLVGKIERDRPLYLIKPSTEDLEDRIKKNCGLENVIRLDYGFLDWVKAGFPKS